MRPLTPLEQQRYHKVRHAVRARTRATDRSGRITVSDIVDTLHAAGYERSHRYVRAVLAGEKISRPALREISAAIRRVRQRREAHLPEWL